MRLSRYLSRALFVCGILLIVAALIIFMWGSISRARGTETRETILKKLGELTPDTFDAVRDDKGNTDMSSVQIDGYDIIGCLEVPVYDRKLPVCNDFTPEIQNVIPHRYSGSIHNGTLVISGSGHGGQFDFMKKISVADPIYFTDVDGGRYSFTVDDVKITKDVSLHYFDTLRADLIFFARNVYSFDYTVVICSYN